MELNELKSAWTGVQAADKTNDEIILMLKENKHPVLKGIRKQLTIEIMGWSAFLVCYYSMFDGGNKSIQLNIILVVSILLALMHNVVGYSLAKNLVNGTSLRDSLNRYLAKIKNLRRCIDCCPGIVYYRFPVVFTYGINFDTRKYFLLAFIILTALAQLLFLNRIWLKRLRELKEAVINFD